MTQSLRDSLYESIASIRLIDPHTHINPHSPASSTLADLLGYHYYTELAHSAGMPKQRIEEEGIPPKELVERLVRKLGPLENTAQYRWLIEICRMFFGFDGDRLDVSNWEAVYDAAESSMAMADWSQTVLDQSNVEAVFLTNDFDDALEGFDTDTYIPCLRTDDLVFHLSKSTVRERLQACSGIELQGNLQSLRAALRQRFEHFVGRGARACAISLPPTFSPVQVSDGRATTALNEVLRRGELADHAHTEALSRRVFWTLAELCEEFGLPFDLMIGVNRGVYADGVFQGQDLYDSRVSLLQYRELFNAFPAVKFPISVLASVTNQELVSHAWIFPNVITNGHWWYSNTPSFIARDAAARLEAVPKTKQIAYYSDAYKLEFVWPKFDMYRHVLADILAEHFVKRCGWSEERAVELGRQVLRDNVDTIFPKPIVPAQGSEDSHGVESDPNDTLEDVVSASATASLAAGGFGMVEDSGDQDSDPSDTYPVDSTADTVVIEREPMPMEPPASSDEGSLDPIPSLSEVSALPVDDVQLDAPGLEAAAPDPAKIEAEADPEPLDFGDLGADELHELAVRASSASPSAEESDIESFDTLEIDLDDDSEESVAIKPLRNEQGFAADDESLRLTPDPATGELRFEPSDDDDPESTVQIDETIEIESDDEEVDDLLSGLDDEPSGEGRT